MFLAYPVATSCGRPTAKMRSQIQVAMMWRSLTLTKLFTLSLRESAATWSRCPVRRFRHVHPVIGLTAEKHGRKSGDTTRWQYSSFQSMDWTFNTIQLVSGKRRIAAITLQFVCELHHLVSSPTVNKHSHDTKLKGFRQLIEQIKAECCTRSKYCRQPALEVN